MTKVFNRADMLLLEKCNYNKKLYATLSWVIYPLTQQKKANQQQQKKIEA